MLILTCLKTIFPLFLDEFDFSFGATVFIFKQKRNLLDKLGYKKTHINKKKYIKKIFKKNLRK